MGQEGGSKGSSMGFYPPPVLADLFQLLKSHQFVSLEYQDLFSPTG